MSVSISLYSTSSALFFGMITIFMGKFSCISNLMASLIFLFSLFLSTAFFASFAEVTIEN